MAESSKLNIDQSQLLVGIALSGSRKAKNVVKWAVEKFLPECDVTFKLIHVYPKINVVPAPMGTWLPISQVREDVLNSYRQEVRWNNQKKLIPHQKKLNAQKIKAEIVLLESDDISMAISMEIARQSIRHLVIGNTSTGIFSMKNYSMTKSQIISENAPSFCSVYVIGSDARLQQIRPADSESTVISMDHTNHSQSSIIQPEPVTLLEKETQEFDRPCVVKNTYFDSSNASVQSHSSSSEDIESWISYQKYHNGGSFGAPCSNSSSFIGGGTPTSTSSATTTPTGSYVGTSPAVSRTGTPIGGSYVGTPPTYVSTSPADSRTGTPIGVSYVGTPPNYKVVSFQAIPSSSDKRASQSQITELERLRTELKNIEKMYELSHYSSDVDEISKKQPEEPSRLKNNEKGKELETKKYNFKEVEDTKIKTKEYKLNKETTKDKKATQEAEESKNKLKELFSSPKVHYQKFTWEEIMEATSSLSDEFKIGMGAFGTVYKCKLHYTTVAIKVLHSKNSVTNKQFVQELAILSTIRHPHLLLLLGAVPEESCLVYEYMDHGSLDDRLFKKNGKPPLPWYDRFRICYEVAGALAFLHSTTPRPIIHRDLKPANILLDHNLVSKIGDAGLGTMINVEPNDQSLKTIYKETSPVGTLCYIDPEYQRTGRVSTKSDIYALGIVMLQLLTAKHAVGIAYVVEDAIDEGTLDEILDPEAGEWPEKDTLELALLALQCAELRGRDRPDLREKIIPILERLNELSTTARESVSSAHKATPSHYFCPILKDMMEDPYVAADGYTYERSAIEQWLNENDTSPTTNQTLPHKFIMPNTSLLEAIKHWKLKNN